MRACAARGILVHYVPAKLTWLLQPLDTHAFSRFKVVIGCEYWREIMKHGQCELAAMLRIVAYAVKKVLQGVRWSYAFDGNGFGQVQTKVRQTILNELQRDSAVGASSQLPAYDQFILIFPRRATLPLADLLAFHRRRLAAEASVPVAAESLQPPAPQPSPEHNPWRGRLRSSSAVSLQAGDEQASAAASSAAATAASPAAASASSGGGGLAVHPPYSERLFIPVARPRPPTLQKRKSTEL